MIEGADRFGRGPAERIACWMRRWNLRIATHLHDTNSLQVHPVIFDSPIGGECAAMLKLIDEAGDEHQAGDVLRYWSGLGAVEVFASEVGALLMERARPGTPLSEWVERGDDDAATEVLAETIAALHRPDAPGPAQWGEKPLPDVERWGKGFDRYLERPPHRLLDATRIARARELYFDLCRSQGARKLLHGDLHHDNLLLDADRGWRVIDPKGVIGESAYETGAMLRNPHGMVEFYGQPRRLRRRIAILCERLQLDRDRVAGWCEAQAVLSALWHLEDAGEDGKVEKEIVDALRIADASRGSY